ncbi:MAG: hypothetical protein ACOC8F_01190 [Planctomycetota bacterium]
MPVAAQQATTGPAGTRSGVTQPATRPAAPSTRPLDNPGLIPLTQAQWESWQAALRDTDRMPPDEGPLFYELLRHVSELEPLDDEVVARLPSPAYQDLVENPRKHAGPPVRPVRLAVRVLRVYVLTPKDHLPPTRAWQAERKIYKIHAVNDVEQSADQPLILYSAHDPQDVLGEPDANEVERGVPCRRYDGDLPRARVVGIFYKAYDGQYRDPQGRMHEHRWPVILASQFVPLADEQGFTSMHMGILIAILLMAVALFVYLKRRTSQADRGNAPRYEPLRNRPDQPGGEQGAGEEVDPQLRSAVEDYRKRRGRQDDQNRPG